MNKKYYRWFLLLILPVSIFITFGIFFLSNPDRAEWLELSLSTSTSIATTILGIMVYIQSEKHKASNEQNNIIFQKEEQAYRESDLIIRTAPYIAFREIEFAESSEHTSYGIDPYSPDCLICVDSQTQMKEISTKEFVESYCRGVFFRFIFYCQEERGLNNIIFKSVNIYPKYRGDNQRTECTYYFENLCTQHISNISYLGQNVYQVCKYFMFPSDDLSQSILAKRFEYDLISDGQQVFFNICYEATNIYGIKTTGELKFITTVTIQDECYNFSKPKNVSNWLDIPQKSSSFYI